MWYLFGNLVINDLLLQKGSIRLGHHWFSLFLNVECCDVIPAIIPPLRYTLSPYLFLFYLKNLPKVDFVLFIRLWDIFYLLFLFYLWLLHLILLLLLLLSGIHYISKSWLLHLWLALLVGKPLIQLDEILFFLMKFLNIILIDMNSLLLRLMKWQVKPIFSYLHISWCFAFAPHWF